MSSLSPRALALSQAYGTPDPGVDWERMAAVVAPPPLADGAVARIKHYIAMRDAQPIRQSAGIIHGIHSGTQWEAYLLLSDLRTVMAVFSDAPNAE